MKLIIMILPIGIILIAMFYTFTNYNKGAKMDSFMKKKMKNMLNIVEIIFDYRRNKMSRWIRLSNYLKR